MIQTAKIIGTAMATTGLTGAGIGIGVVLNMLKRIISPGHLNKILFLLTLYNRLTLINAYLNLFKYYLKLWEKVKKITQPDIALIKGVLIELNDNLCSNLLSWAWLKNFIRWVIFLSILSFCSTLSQNLLISSLALSIIKLSIAFFVFITLVTWIIKINFTPWKSKLTKTQLLLFNILTIALALILFIFFLVNAYFIYSKLLVIFKALKKFLRLWILKMEPYGSGDPGDFEGPSGSKPRPTGSGGPEGPEGPEGPAGAGGSAVVEESRNKRKRDAESDGEQMQAGEEKNFSTAPEQGETREESSEISSLSVSIKNKIEDRVVDELNDRTDIITDEQYDANFYERFYEIKSIEKWKKGVQRAGRLDDPNSSNEQDKNPNE